MALVGKEDKSLDPMDVALLRAMTEVSALNRVPHLIKQPRRLCRRDRFSLHRPPVVGLPGRVLRRNVLTQWEDDSRCYILCGLQTDHNWQLKSQLILVRRFLDARPKGNPV